MRGAATTWLRSSVVIAGLLVLCGCARESATPVGAVWPSTQPVTTATLAVQSQPSIVRAACPYYARAMGDVSPPRDLIKRGITYATAVVRFTVTKDAVVIDNVEASDPAMADFATRIVRSFECTVDKPMTFEVPIKFERN